MEQSAEAGMRAVISLAGLKALIEALARERFSVLGPCVRNGAIVYDKINNLEDLPAGWTDEQEAGRYRLDRRNDGALFGYAVGPHSWKHTLHPPVQTLWTAQKTEDGFAVTPGPIESPKVAFLGVRACEIHAIAIQDRIFCDGPYLDEAYTARRQNAFIVAVNCGVAGGTCFCVSMQTGPKAESGFDLALTELIDDGHHSFLVEAGSEAGAAILDRLPHEPDTDGHLEAAGAVWARTASQMGRSLDTNGLKELLQGNLRHPAGTRPESAALLAETAPWCVPLVSARQSRTAPISRAQMPNV